MAGWIANGIVSYWVGRHAARPLLYRFVGRHRFDRLERMAEARRRHSPARHAPGPGDPFQPFPMVAGAARAPVPTFLWTTAVGYLPLTAVFVYLGSQLEELSPPTRSSGSAPPC